MTEMKRTRRVLILLVLTALLVAACGDDDGGDAGLAVGDEAPAFSLGASEGSTVSLADYDDPVFLFFHMADG